MPTTADEAESQDERTFSEELERLKGTKDSPPPYDERHDFAVEGENFRATATFVSHPEGDEERGGVAEFGQGFLSLRIPFDTCQTPRGYIADVLASMNAVAKEGDAPAGLPDDFTTDRERAKEAESRAKTARAMLHDALHGIGDKDLETAAKEVVELLED